MTEHKATPGYKHPKTCRTIIITEDGKRYLGPWRGGVTAALRAAYRYADRRKLKVKQVDAMVPAAKADEDHYE